MKKLTYENNWEADSYKMDRVLFGEKNLPELSKVKIKSISINGKIFNNITTGELSVPYSDHGHDYNGTSTHIYIRVEIAPKILISIDLNTIITRRGVKVLIELESKMVKTFNVKG